MLNFSGFAMANDIRYIINRTIIIDIYPLHYFRIFFPTRKIKYLSW
jgi:hypothetical protein